MRNHFQVLSIFFSLGLHGAIASFLLLPPPKVVEKESFAIEVQWEKASKEGSAKISVESHILPHYPRETPHENEPANEVKNPSPAPSGRPLPQGERVSAQASPLPLWERSINRAAIGRVRGLFTSLPTGPAKAVELQEPQKLEAPSTRFHGMPRNDNKEGKSQSFVSVAKNLSLKNSVKKSYHPLPKYPWVCRKRGQEGSVSVLVQTNGEGRVIRANLHKSSGYSSLDQSALNAVKTWVFSGNASQKILSFAFRLKG